MQGITKARRKKWSIAISLAIGSACASGGDLGRKRFSIADRPETSDGTSEGSSAEVPASKLLLKDLRIHLLELVFGPDWIGLRIQLTNEGNTEIRCQPEAIFFAYHDLEYSPQVLPPSEDSDLKNESEWQELSFEHEEPSKSSTMLQVAAKQQVQLNLRYQIGKEVAHRSELVFRGLVVHDRWLYSPRMAIPARGALLEH